jgi:hypothetical protein
MLVMIVLSTMVSILANRPGAAGDAKLFGDN